LEVLWLGVEDEFGLLALTNGDLLLGRILKAVSASGEISRLISSKPV
jgi:hypothetical protein